MRFRDYGWDVETHLIEPGNCCPRLVCMSLYEPLSGVSEVFGRKKALEVFRSLLLDPDARLIAHSHSYDVCVMLKEDPSLFDLIFDGYGEKFICTKAQEQLLRIAQNADLRKLSLADLVLKYFDKDISESKEDKDSWRLNYHKLDGIPVSEWPKEAFDYALSDSIYAYRLNEIQRKGTVLSKFSNMEILADAPAQVEAAFALNLMRIWGIRVDPLSAAALKKEVLKSVYEAQQVGVSMGFIREDGSRNMSVLRDHVSDAFGGNPPQTIKGNIQTSKDVLFASGSDGLAKYARGSQARKILTTYIPVLEQGTFVPINAYFNALVRTGRTSCSYPNLQNLPRIGGIREAFIPREEGMVFCSIDYDSIELRALAQVHINFFGKSTLAEAFIAGEDPHLTLAAHIMGIDYAEAYERRMSPEMKNMRSLAKICNFGYAGGLSSASLVPYAANYGVSVTSKEASALRDQWFDRWKEMKPYFQKIGRLTRSGEATIVQEYSGRIRGGVTFTACANTFFQGLCADGAKSGLFQLQRACYSTTGGLEKVRPVIFLHDEIIAEGPAETAHIWSEKMKALMIDAMAEVIPNVPITAEAILMERWYKNAVPTFENGRLVPWRPDIRTQVSNTRSVA